LLRGALVLDILGDVLFLVLDGLFSSFVGILFRDALVFHVVGRHVLLNVILIDDLAGFVGIPRHSAALLVLVILFFFFIGFLETRLIVLLILVDGFVGVPRDAALLLDILVFIDVDGNLALLAVEGNLALRVQPDTTHETRLRVDMVNVHIALECKRTPIRHHSVRHIARVAVQIRRLLRKVTHTLKVTEILVPVLAALDAAQIGILVQIVHVQADQRRVLDAIQAHADHTFGHHRHRVVVAAQPRMAILIRIIPRVQTLRPIDKLFADLHRTALAPRVLRQHIEHDVRVSEHIAHIVRRRPLHLLSGEQVLPQQRARVHRRRVRVRIRRRIELIEPHILGRFVVEIVHLQVLNQRRLRVPQRWVHPMDRRHVEVQEQPVHSAAVGDSVVVDEQRLRLLIRGIGRSVLLDTEHRAKGDRH